MYREDHGRSDLSLTRIPSPRHGVPVLALLVALLVVGATVLAVTSRPAGPSPPAVSLLSVPAPILPDRTSPLGTIHPAGDSATVLDTISTFNGTTRPGNQPYPGGQYPFNVTVAGNRIAVVAEYSSNVLLVNATNGELVDAPELPGEGVPVASAYDPLNGALYVADLSGRSVVELDPDTGDLLGTIAVPGYPQAIAFDAVHDQLIVVTGPGTSFGYGFLGASYILFVDPTTGTVLANDSTGANPVSLAVDPQSSQVYVVDEGSDASPGSYGNVSTYSTVTHALIAQLPAAGGPVAVEFDPILNEIFTANLLNHTLSVFNGSSHALVTTVALTPGPNLLTYDPRAQQVDAESEGYSDLIRVNATTNVVNSTVGFAVNCDGFAYSESTNRFFVSDPAQNDLAGLNATTLQLETDTPFGLDPLAAALDPNTGTLFVVNSQTGNISTINVISNRVLGNISAGSDPSSLVYDNASDRIYVTDLGGGLLVIDPANDSVVGSIPVGSAPSQVVYDAANERLYVVNEESYNVTVVSGTTGSVLESIALATDETPYSEAIDTATGVLFIGEFTGYAASSLVPIDLASDTVGTGIPFPGTIDQVAYDPGNGDVVLGYYAAHASTGSVLLVDPVTGAIVETVPGGEFIGTVGWLPALGVLAWGDYETNSLTVFGGSPGLVLTSTAVGAFPAATVANPETGRIYVVNDYSSSVSVVSFSEQPNSVAVATNPASCGPVDFGGSSTNGSVSIDSGVYSAVAPACYDYTFDGWSVSGGVSVAGATNASTQVTVVGNGTLTAVYTLSPDARYTVTIVVTPASCGSVVTLAGQEYANGASVALAPASYPLGAAPCSGYTFSAWQLAGLVSVVVQGPLGGVLTVSGNGTLTAVYVSEPSGTGSSGGGGGSSGYSATELVAFVAVGVLAGALVGLLVGRRGPPPPPTPPSEPPKATT
ncbi:MAG: YncE family protein [Thermoplasmata archaeon]